MQALPLSLASETLLFVDDEPLMAELFRHSLTKRGYHVLTACNGAQALQLLADAHGEVDLVVTDMTMPGMDGVELASTLARDWPLLPVLLATGYDTGMEPGSLPGNIVGVVQKPFQKQALPDQIRAILDSRHAENDVVH